MNKCCNNCIYSQNGFKNITSIYDNPCFKCFMFSYWQPLNYYTIWYTKTAVHEYDNVSTKTESVYK